MTIRLYRLSQVPLNATWFILVTKRQFPEFLCTCVLRSTGQRRFQCSYEDAFHSGSISTSSAVPINKNKGDPWNPGGVISSGVADTSERRDGRPEGEREPEEQVFLMGGETVLGRSVQRKEEQAAVWELNSTSSFSSSTGICLFGSKLCPVLVIA